MGISLDVLRSRALCWWNRHIREDFSFLGEGLAYVARVEGS